ncbi:hypothetical protein G4B88_030265 [Cannabis sativa]|uniref:protein-tyrosine-phosphatase n=1 Tax=Cannabis sativa TaxID=3483 RepID=A0A7J6GET5_CANSA|nr:hypothetical protein G4B88_030265 [Cannabis sativa]
MALTEDGKIMNWGAHFNYEIGSGDNIGGWKPTPVTSLEDVRIMQIASGGYHSLALTDDGKMLLWGHGGHGQLGHSSISSCKTPEMIEALANERVVYIACGGSSSAAVTARTFLEECSTGKEETSVATADGITDSAASKSQHVNVLVTSGSLIPSLVKCLLFRFDNIITHENVYSSWDVGKPQCFQWIKERFNSSSVRFCVIGDGWEECEAAEIMQWPFIKIDPRPGCTERFPGLTLKTIGFYLSVVYGNSEPEDD